MAAVCSSSVQADRAVSTSPITRAISTWATHSLARDSALLPSTANAVRIGAAAVSARSCASLGHHPRGPRPVPTAHRRPLPSRRFHATGKAPHRAAAARQVPLIEVRQDQVRSLPREPRAEARPTSLCASGHDGDLPGPSPCRPVDDHDTLGQITRTATAYQWAEAFPVC